MTAGHILALSGGVGGAKLASGLAAILPPERLTIAVNTGDDFEHLGLTVCPDIDSVAYAMAGLNDRQRGWGMADETWQAMARLKALGEADWFNLGDRDLAMHIARSWRLRAGESLSAVTARLTAALGIAHSIIPMSDDPLRTQVETDDGWLDFQSYFVGEQCRPAVKAIRFTGSQTAEPSAGLIHALTRPDLAAVVICPSNPFLSIDPFLALKGLRGTLSTLSVPCIAVSPLVGGNALKGPLSKLLDELGLARSNQAIAEYYGTLLNHLVIDTSDKADADSVVAMGLEVSVLPTVMKTNADQAELARAVLTAVGAR
ncbi:MAG: hypothetical protein RLZZ136_1254 [Pseudomonadota bacterium]|jgi:LPPG:FO 2-phospho-L-lactate transferase